MQQQQQEVSPYHYIEQSSSWFGWPDRRAAEIGSAAPSNEIAESSMAAVLRRSEFPQQDTIVARSKRQQLGNKSPVTSFWLALAAIKCRRSILPFLHSLYSPNQIIIGGPMFKYKDLVDFRKIVLFRYYLRLAIKSRSVTSADRWLRLAHKAQS